MRRLIMLVVLALTACSSAPAQPTTIANNPTETRDTATVAIPTAPAETATRPIATPSVAPSTPTIANPAAPVLADGVIVLSDQGMLDLASGQSTDWNTATTDYNHNLPWALSPDLTTFAFVDYTEATNNGVTSLQAASLWLASHDGRNERVALHLVISQEKIETLEVLKANPPLWTSTGEVITLSFHDQQPDIYAVNAQTGAVRRLTNTPELETALALDPTGTQLGYISQSANEQRAWIHPIAGTATQIVVSSIPQVGHGWIGDRFFFQAINPTTMQPIITSAHPNGDIAELPVWGEVIRVDGVPNQIVVAASGAGSSNTPTLLWDGAAAVQALATPPLHTMSVSPNRQLIYGCFANDDTGQQQIFDLNGNVVWQGNEGCTTIYWSPDSQFAALDFTSLMSKHGIGGLPPYLINLQNPEAATVNKFIGDDSGWYPVGWVDQELVYYISDGSTNNETAWQFYRYNPADSGKGQAIGPRFLRSIYNTQLILPATAVLAQLAPPIANPSSIPTPAPSGMAPTGQGVLILPSHNDGSVTAVNLETLASTFLVDPTKKESETKPPMAFSPDQQTMAVLLHPSSLAGVELWTVNLDGSNARKLKDVYISGREQEYPIYAPDPAEHEWGPLLWTPNNELLVVDLENGQIDIQAIDSQTGLPRPLTNSPASEYNLLLNDAGTTLAYLSGNNLLEEPTDVQLWVQDLNGEPQELLAGDPLLKAPNLRILGWFNDQVILQSVTEYPENNTVISISLDGTVKTLEYPHSITNVAITKQSILISVLNFNNDHPTPSITYDWDGRNEPETIIAEHSYKLYPAPDGEHFIGCQSPTQSGSEYWMFDRQGAKTTFGYGLCWIDVRWSPESQFAMVGNFAQEYSSHYEDGLLVDRQGTVINHLGVGAIPAGWIAGDALYFAPINNAWQLFRLTPGAEGRGNLLGTFDGVPDQPFYSEP